MENYYSLLPQVIPVRLPRPGLLCGMDAGRLPGAGGPSGPVCHQPGPQPGLDAGEPAFISTDAVWCTPPCPHSNIIVDDCMQGPCKQWKCTKYHKYMLRLVTELLLPCSSSSTRRTSSWPRLTTWVRSPFPTDCRPSASLSPGFQCSLHLLYLPDSNCRSYIKIGSS